MLRTNASAFQPGYDMERLIVHEFGHARGAIDNYWIGVLGKNNQAFPWAEYQWPGPSYMGRGPSAGKTWDPLSIELFRNTAGFRWLDFDCSEDTLSSWAPKTIKIRVTDGAGTSLPNAKIDLYRIRYHPIEQTQLKVGDLWKSGTTDSQGFWKLPEGLAQFPNDFYSTYLAAVYVDGKPYLNWYSLLDIAVPYRKGVKDLTLQAKADATTLYQPPPIITTDLNVEGHTLGKTSAKFGEIVPDQITLRNLGPDAYNGDVVLQLYASSDAVYDKYTDKPAGGGVYPISVPAGGTYIFNQSLIFPATFLPAGAYYMVASVEPQLPGATDPNPANNVRVSDQAVTLSAP